MKTLNKSLLAAAVIGAIALPSLVSAATLEYAAGKQITFARDLIVDNGKTIRTPNTLIFRGEDADLTRVRSITGAKNQVTVKVTLTNGALFDSTADVLQIVGGFIEGTQTGGSGLPDDDGLLNGGSGTSRLVGTPYYSATGQELNFTYTTRLPTATDTGNVGAGDFLTLNSFQIANLVQSLGSFGSVDAEITAHNQDGQQVLSARQTIARSAWAPVVRSAEPLTPDADKMIDVASVPRKVLFSPDGAIGGSLNADGTPAAGSTYFNAGGFVLDIAKAVPTGGGAESYINDFNAVADVPQFNIVGTAQITVTVNGSNLLPFAGGRARLARLDGTDTCANVAAANTAALAITNAAPEVASVTVSANHPLFQNVTNPGPGPSTVYVCLSTGTNADTFREMDPQTLSGSLSIDYGLSTQRVNPPARQFALAPLRLNGATIYFQNVNPAGNTTAESFLRLTNHNAQICPVTIDAKDDLGRLSGEVKLTLAAHASEQLNINVLESGNDSRFEAGSGFRDGAGKWYVRITAECTHFTGSALNRNSTTGVVTDLTPQETEGDEWAFIPTAPVP